MMISLKFEGWLGDGEFRTELFSHFVLIIF